MNKKFLTLGLTAIICSFLSLVFVNTSTAKAETTISYTTFIMENGASARIKSLTDGQGNVVESNGMRFLAEISQTEYDNLKAIGARFGVVIVAKDLLKGTDINESTVFGEKSAFYFTNEEGGDKSKIAMLHISNPSCQNVDDDAQIEISGAIVNILTSNFTRSFVGRAYVAIPQTNAETGETEYTYHFAPYYEDDINNNTRCIYYVAQRAIEESKTEAATLQEKYIKPFESTSRYQNYTYRYTVEHCYVGLNENNQLSILHTEKKYLYATLNTTVEASPIIKPEGIPAIDKLNFIYDVDASLDTKSGLVYAGGMQTLRLYYESTGTISEEHKLDSIEALIADFLKVDNAENNFGLHLSNNATDWEANPVWEDPNNPTKQIGISLMATQNANQNRYLLLSKEFFDKLRAFGVESVSFSFHSAPGSKKDTSYKVYQEEDTSKELPVYDAISGAELTNQTIDSTVHSQIKLYLKDITTGGGVLIEVTTNSTSSIGQYHFGNITFEFPSTNPEA